MLQLLSLTGQELAGSAKPGKAVTLFLRRTLIPQVGGQTAHQEKEVITAIIQTTPTHGVEHPGGAGGNGGTTGAAAAVVPIISAISKRNMEKQALTEPQRLLET